MPFPAVKLVSLFLKQLSKPLAAYIKRQAKEHPFLRTYICIPPAQWYHRLDFRLRMWSAGIGRNKDLKAKPLSEEAALDMGADALGELFLYTVGAGAIALEYWRQTANAAQKEKKQDDTLIILRQDLNKVIQVVESREQVIEKLIKSLENHQSKDFKFVKAQPKQEEKAKPKS